MESTNVCDLWLGVQEIQGLICFSFEGDIKQNWKWSWRPTGSEGKSAGLWSVQCRLLQITFICRVVGWSYVKYFNINIKHYVAV